MLGYIKHVCPTNTVILINTLLRDFQNISKCIKNIVKCISGSKELFGPGTGENRVILLQFCVPDDWKNFPQTDFWLHVCQTMFLLHHAHAFSGRSFSSPTGYHAGSGLILLRRNVGESQQRMVE